MNTLLDRIGLFSQTRWPWLVIAILSAGLVLIAHNVFQVWLYMKPCEQCVYIRFAFLCMTFGCLFTLAWPKALITRIIAYVCGYDNSDVPLGTVLSPLQESIIQMYSDAGGWYLIPSMKFMSMAQCCLLGFAVALLIYVILFVGDMKHTFGKPAA